MLFLAFGMYILFLIFQYQKQKKHLVSENREIFRIEDAFSADVKKMSVGMNGHIAKPVEIPKLLKVLEKWLVKEFYE